jgi:hypothetical protein
MWGTRSFYFGDNVSVGVRNLDSAVAWYKEKLAAISHSLAEGNEVCSNWDLRDVLRGAVV